MRILRMKLWVAAVAVEVNRNFTPQENSLCSSQCWDLHNAGGVEVGESDPTTTRPTSISHCILNNTPRLRQRGNFPIMHHEHTDIFNSNWSEAGDVNHLKIMRIYIVDFSNAGNKFGLLDVKLQLFFDPREAYSSRKYKLRKMKEWRTIVIVQWTLCVWGHVYQSQNKSLEYYVFWDQIYVTMVVI